MRFTQVVPDPQSCGEVHAGAQKPWLAPAASKKQRSLELGQGSTVEQVAHSSASALPEEDEPPFEPPEPFDPVEPTLEPFDAAPDEVVAPTTITDELPDAPLPLDPLAEALVPSEVPDPLEPGPLPADAEALAEWPVVEAAASLLPELPEVEGPETPAPRVPPLAPAASFAEPLLPPADPSEPDAPAAIDPAEAWPEAPPAALA